jgi:hypothetical protein
MKALSHFTLTTLVLGFVLLVLILIPTSIEAASEQYATDSRRSAHDPAPRCPAGARSGCNPRLVGSVVICTEQENITGYNSVSEYCLACHANSRPMAFNHPLQVSYPSNNAKFRAMELLDRGIVLEAGNLTCRTCHAGLSASNHYLVSQHSSDRICSHCHLTGVECPTEVADLRTVCYPGRLNGGVRCVVGREISIYDGTSEYCADCHGSIQSMARAHPVEVQYPLNKSGYRHVVDLDPKIKLEDGMITCETCHAKMSEGIALCVHCHPK